MERDEAVKKLSEFINKQCIWKDTRQELHDALSHLENKSIRYDECIKR